MTEKPFKSAALAYNRVFIAPTVYNIAGGVRGLIRWRMRPLLIALLAASACACLARKTPTSDRILDGCLARGRAEADCKRAAGCGEDASLEDCRRSFRKRHKLYINYD